MDPQTMGPLALTGRVTLYLPRWLKSEKSRGGLVDLYDDFLAIEVRDLRIDLGKRLRAEISKLPVIP